MPGNATNATSNATGGAAAPPTGGGGGLPGAASRGLNQAAQVAGDIVRAAVPDFVIDRIPFLLIDGTNLALDSVGALM